MTFVTINLMHILDKKHNSFGIKTLLYHCSVKIEMISCDVNDDYEDESLMMIVYSDGMKDVVESLDEVECFGISRQPVPFLMLIMMMIMKMMTMMTVMTMIKIFGGIIGDI